MMFDEIFSVLYLTDTLHHVPPRANFPHQIVFPFKQSLFVVCIIMCTLLCSNIRVN